MNFIAELMKDMKEHGIESPIVQTKVHDAYRAYLLSCDTYNLRQLHGITGIRPELTENDYLEAARNATSIYGVKEISDAFDWQNSLPPRSEPQKSFTYLL